MSDDFSITTGTIGEPPWHVSMTRVGAHYVVRLHVGDFTVVLPALEAHKLGSALHAASGLNNYDPEYEFVGWRDRTNDSLCSCAVDHHDELTHQRVYVSEFSTQNLEAQGPPARQNPQRPDDDGKP